jgi:DNA-binding transcriptional LysR family regulator
MDKLVAMRAFVQTAEHGSIKRGAAALGKSAPTVVRILADLERELGVVLLRRNTRRMSLTEEGARYLEHCRGILAAVVEAERGLVADKGEPQGKLRVTAPSLFGQMHVMPALVEFSRRYPAIQLDVLLVDRLVDLVAEGVDVAIRIGPVSDSLLAVRTVGRMHRTVVASPELLERVGQPDHPGQLANLPCVLYSGLTTSAEWRFEEASGGETRHGFAVTVRSNFRINQAGPAIQACIAGLGFGKFAAYQTDAAIRADKLRPVLREFECPPVPVTILYPQVRMMPPRLRALLDWLGAHLQTCSSY